VAFLRLCKGLLSYFIVDQFRYLNTKAFLKSSLVYLISCILIQSATPCFVSATISFEDVSQQSGIHNLLPTAASAWGDLNGDGWPDLWVSNHHMKPPSLYLNLRNGSFLDVAPDTLSEDIRADFHGAAWADFDNDGDQDLFVTTGAGAGRGSSPNYLFVNQDGKLWNKALRLGVDYPHGRGRTPLWFDADRDGKLDLLIMNNSRPDGKAPSAIFQQTANGFVTSNDKFEFRPSGSRSRLKKLKDLFDNVIHLRKRKGPGKIITKDCFAQLADLTGDHMPDLITYVQPLRVYSTVRIPFKEVTNDVGFPYKNTVGDIAIEDFDGDGRMDMFLVRAAWSSDIRQVGSRKLRGRIGVGKAAGFKAVHFRSKGEVTFNIYGPWKDASDPQKGLPVVSAGQLPLMPADGRSFTLSPLDSSITTAIKLPKKGVTITYDPVISVWKLRSSLPRINFIVTCAQPVDQIQAIGFTPSKGDLTDDLLIKKKGSDRFESFTASGIADRAAACNSVAAGDFDNDMDVDLYLVCTGPTQNKVNILYENDGTGRFIEIPNAGGAGGSQEGIGNQVSCCDYDRDGFLDLFVTNGAGPPPFSNDGPHQLFRNKGNANHWLEIDLRGTLSNRDGIGSEIELEAGGKTQLRCQGGGMHSFSQNQQRIHFGLGRNTKVSRITIRWVSGVVQELRDIAVDQILQITEPAPKQQSYKH
jgi:hypothetical protein